MANPRDKDRVVAVTYSTVMVASVVKASTATHSYRVEADVLELGDHECEWVTRQLPAAFSTFVAYVGLAPPHPHGRSLN